MSLIGKPGTGFPGHALVLLLLGRDLFKLGERLIDGIAA